MAQKIAATGTVKSVSADLAMVVPSAGVGLPAIMTIDSAKQFDGLPLDSFLAVGDVVSGTFDADLLRFTPDFGNRTPEKFARAFPEGSVILAKIAEVARQYAIVYPHPSVPVRMSRSDFSTNERDVIDHHWNRGDVVRVRVVRDPRGHLGLFATDVDDDEIALPATELIEGRGPWLAGAEMSLIESLKSQQAAAQKSRDEFERALAVLANRMETDAESIEHLLVGGSSTGEIPVVTEPVLTGRDRSNQEFAQSQFRRMIANYQVAIEKFQEQIRQVSAESITAARREAEAVEENQRLRRELSGVRQGAQTLEKQLHAADAGTAIADRRDHFATADQWIAEEIRRAWIDTYLPADREVFPLHRVPWRILPSFVETFIQFDDGQQAKALRVAVHILTGRIAEANMPEDHPLREHDSATAPEVERGDGAKCRRAYIESHTPSARRLHYWKSPDGSIELSRVGLHDDYTP